jgi:phage baseplate assembly protein V
MDVRGLIDRAVEPVRRRVRLLIGRCVLDAIDDSGGIQSAKLSLFADEVRDGVERMQEFGFTSRPVPGCEGVTIFPTGDRSHGIVIATDDRRHRPTGLNEGESRQYNAFNEYIYLRDDGTLAISAGTKVHVTAPEVVADCDTAAINASTSATVDTDVATVKATSSAEIDTPETTVTGQLTVQGSLLAQAGLAVSGTAATGGSSSMSVDGDIDMGTSDIQFDGLSSYRGHTHDENDGGTTGTPN